MTRESISMGASLRLLPVNLQRPRLNGYESYGWDIFVSNTSCKVECASKTCMVSRSKETVLVPTAA